MPYGNSVSVECAICGESFVHGKKLSNHLKKIHAISSIDYVIKYKCDGVRPSCPCCGGETRFVSLIEGFKKYCAKDATLAESAAGKIGGVIKKTWNKGLTKETDARVAAYAESVSGDKNHFFGKKHNIESMKKVGAAIRLDFDDVVRRIHESANVTVRSAPDEYVTQNSLLSIECNTCHTADNVSLFNIQRCWRCRKCVPIGSRAQLDVAQYVQSLGFDVENSTRKVIAPLELDVWVPSKNLAIEYHGLYWHSGGKNDVFDKQRHRQKYDACCKAGIKLLQIFSDEWMNKRQICESIIANALGANSLKLNARDCDVVDVPLQEAEKFIDENHIGGYVKCRHRLGLKHPVHGLVGIATTRTPIQKKWGNVCELARMCFSSGVTIRGGASKLLSHVKERAIHDDFEGVLSYADLRFGSGGVYEKCGLKLVGESTINYWYTDGVSRVDRFVYRAQPGKSEKQVAAENHVRPVWGCGNKIFLWKE